MLKIKELIKKTPIIKAWRFFVQKKEHLQREQFNNKYKKYIEPLNNPEVLEKHVEKLTLQINTKKNLTYYVISLKNERIGIFGYINNILPHIAYAVSRGYVPVIDMKNYHSIYQENKENAWETFFEQPCGIGLDDIRNGRVIYSPNIYWWRWQPDSCPLMSDDSIKMWGRLYQKYVRYNDKAREYLSNEVSEVLKVSNRTLGALYRGTDYAKGHAVGHPIQPSKKVFADKVQEIMQKYHYEYVYLASDEKEIVEYMDDRFPGKVLINKRVYYDEATNVDYSNYNNDHIGVSGAVFNRENNKYLIGMEYISSMNLVAKCDSFVAGACGGTTAVLVINNLKFREKYIFNLGKYGFDPVPEE